MMAAIVTMLSKNRAIRSQSMSQAERLPRQVGGMSSGSVGTMPSPLSAMSTTAASIGSEVSALPRRTPPLRQHAAVVLFDGKQGTGV